jgi:hypothetical protein
MQETKAIAHPSQTTQLRVFQPEETADAEAAARPQNSIPLYVTDGHEQCGYITLQGSEAMRADRQTTFIGTAEVYGNDGALLGTIDIQRHGIRIEATATDQHEAATAEFIPLGRPFLRSELMSHNGETNPLVQMGRAIAENTDKSTDELKSWLQAFRDSPLLQAPTTGKPSDGWAPHGHFF